MDTIYKFCLLGKYNKVNQIIIFANNRNEEIGETIFNSKEQTFIEENNIPVKFSKQQIHRDDSIAIIKNKILKEIDFSVSYHELYLFSNIENPNKNLQTIFDMTSGKEGYINESNFKQLIMNLGISGNSVESIVPKKQYFLEDLISLKDGLKDDSAYYKISIGKKFRAFHDELFSANPYDIFETTKIYHKSSNPLESFENQILLNNNDGVFVDNMISVCLAEDVLEYVEEKNINMEIIISLYFPLLVKQEVTNIASLLEKRENLVKKTKKIASKFVFDTYESVDLFYNIYNSRSKELQYETKGISIFSLFINPEFKHILPLDIIFKNVHATQIIPFIKYNPGSRRENIYRFYSEDITKYGTKIPFLSAKTILKLAKETGKKKQISFSIENENGDFYIDIQNNGSIHISGNNFREPMQLDYLNKVIQSIVNPVIDHMNDFLKKNGYEIKYFQDIRKKDIELEYIKYESTIKIKKEIHFANYIRCLQSIFEMNENMDINKGLQLRFKRVENYNEMDEETIFIASLYKNNKTDRSIVEEISVKYNISFEEAAVKLSKFVKNNQSKNANAKMIVESPGILINMKIDSYDDILKYEIETDNNTIHIHIDYIDIITMYIDSILRMTQEPASTTISKNTISRICKDKVIKTKNMEKFDTIVTGIETNDNIMFMDVYEEDEFISNQKQNQNIEGMDIYDEDAIESTAFGDLKQYESVDITTDIEDIKEYENEEDFEILSPIEESKEREKNETESKSSNSNSNISNISLMFMGEEESDADSKKSDTDAQNNKGGAKKKNQSQIQENDDEDVLLSTNEKKLDGMFLKDNNNNIFLSRLKKKEPTLFLSEDDGKFNAYSTLCQANQQRQPVILTQEEKDKIDENDKASKSKSYNHALEYGTDPDKKYWYICPRYWCLKTNSSISEADVKAGKCGKVIPKGDKVVKKGHYVYEFNHHIQHRSKDGSYKENTPGFLEGSLHPKGLCLPCCFKKNWDSKSQLDRRNECYKKNTDDEQQMKKEKKPKNAKQEEYVYEIRRYPIPPKRWGFLPISVQLFLQIDNSLSVNPDNNKYLRDDKTTTTLLRYGVENSRNKSFVACIADIYAYVKKLKIIPSISEMCEIILNAISIDLFLKYHNGSLVSIFRPKTYEIDNIDPTKYESSAFINKLDKSNDTHLDFINDTIASYENFAMFLKNKESYIDHTYLWDIVCSPNPKLFQSGMNLSILRIKEVDITDDIELLCPTSVYSSLLYDLRKETVILLKHDDYYEPIYLFNNIIEKTAPANIIKKELFIKKTFLEDTVIDSIKEVLKVIRNSIQNYCPPKSSMPRVYTFKKPIQAESLKLILLKYKFKIRDQVLNYQGKTIGFWIAAKEDGILLPCFPTSQLPDISVKFMDDESLWNDYVTTRNRLKKIYSITNGEIPCRPKFKVMEDGLIIGILTETNQFIMISNPTENIEMDGIPLINDENYILADKEISRTKTQDELRIKTIKMITLETQFYSAFRSTVRTLLNQSNNKLYKQQIMEIIENPRYLYKSKLEVIEKIIRKICKNMVVFKTFDELTLMSLNEITDCFSNPIEKKYCFLQPSGEYQIILPDTHLISGFKNDTIYYSRIADEFIRYKRIQLFMMDTKMYLNITNTDYKINEDEMIMLESLLTTEYFKSIEPYEHGKNTKITYETANPVLTQKYSNNISIETQKQMVMEDTMKEEIQDKMGIECIIRKIPIIGNATSQWKNFFPNTANEIELYASIKCSYYPILYIYNKLYNVQMTIEQVKQKLAVEYTKYMEKYELVIIDILRKQGKRDMMDDIRKNKYTFDTAIASEVYFLSTLDLWILAISEKLPIILFHQKKLKNLIANVNWLKLTDPPTYTSSKYYFIRVPTEPSIPDNYLPQYNMITPGFKSNSKEIIELFSNSSPNSQMSIDAFFDAKMKSLNP